MSTDQQSRLQEAIESGDGNQILNISLGDKLSYLSDPRQIVWKSFTEANQYFDEQMSKAILGQTGTTEGTARQALGEVQERTLIRFSLERQDAFKRWTELHFVPYLRTINGGMNPYVNIPKRACIKIIPRPPGSFDINSPNTATQNRNSTSKTNNNNE